MTFEALTTPAHRTGRTAHTPGPWSLRHSRDGSDDIGITANGVLNVIAECFAAMRSHDENAAEEALANAHLIAAAPMLAEAARIVCQFDPLNSDDVDHLAEAINGLRAALSASRSTGEA